MSDLISRSELLKKQIEIIDEIGTVHHCVFVDDIEEQPTAYDIDKVVEELKLHSFEFGTDSIPTHYLRFNEAIEIVKQGGVNDDVCEWHCDEYGRWHTECHILADNDPLEYTYCPYCGKKIKVVE